MVGHGARHLARASHQFLGWVASDCAAARHSAPCSNAEKEKGRDTGNPGHLGVTGACFRAGKMLRLF